MLRILGRESSGNVQKVLWLLAELDVAYAREDYGGKFGGNKTPEFLQLNPNGAVPTLVDGPVVLWESNSILRYLANRYGPTALYPTDPLSRAHCEKWMDWQLGTLNRVMGPLYITLVRTPPAERDPVQIARDSERAAELFATLEPVLAHSDYVAGDELSLADISLGMFAHRWLSLEIERPKPTPRLRSWLDRLATRRGFHDHVIMVDFT
jgi:glutathione S-transferase